jgi:hypothetical protein
MIPGSFSQDPQQSQDPIGSQDLFPRSHDGPRSFLLGPVLVLGPYGSQEIRLFYRLL